MLSKVSGCWPGSASAAGRVWAAVGVQNAENRCSIVRGRAVGRTGAPDGATRADGRRRIGCCPTFVVSM